MVFIENETVLLCLTMRKRVRASTCSYNLEYKFLIYLLLLKSSVFVVHFSNAFWHGNEAFPKGSSYSWHYENQNFSLMSHSCHTGVARVWRSCCKLD